MLQAHHSAIKHWLANFVCKGQDSKYFRLVGQMVSVTAAAVRLYSKKGTTDNMEMNECGCGPTKLDFQKETAGQIWPVGCLLLITATDIWGSGLTEGFPLLLDICRLLFTVFLSLDT